MINTPNLQKALNLIAKEEKPIIVKAQDDVFNRKIMETGKISILLDIELEKLKESKLKEASSGLNHVLANIAKKNNISIGISFDKISTLSPKEKSLALEKIKQNLKFIEKKKLNLAVFNSKNKHQALALLRSLGASSQITQRTQYF